MTSKSWAMPLRTRLLVRVVERERGNVAEMSLEQLRTAREWVAPARAPYTWVTGPVYSDVDIEDGTFPARHGVQVPVRVYRPTLPGASASVPRPDRLPCLVFFHGGGWSIGRPRGYDPLASFIAHEAGVVVVSVDYRLAPEHRAPQAVHDAVDAVRWVGAAGEELRVRPDGLGIAGDSAGGNLSAVVTQVVHREGGGDIGYQCLIYPATDATMSHPSNAEHARAAVLPRPVLDAYLGHYLGPDDSKLDARDPLLSPLFATSFAGLPPALVQTADLDPLRDEGMAYAARLRGAGVTVRATNYTGAPHGFMSFPGATKVGRAARRELAEWVAVHAHAVH